MTSMKTCWWGRMCEAATILKALVRIMFSGREEPLWDSGIYHFNQIFRYLVSRNVPRHSQSKTQIAASCRPCHKEGSLMPVSLFGSWGHQIPPLRYWSGLWIRWCKRLPILIGAQSRKLLFALLQGHALMQSILPLQSDDSADTIVPMVRNAFL